MNCFRRKYLGFQRCQFSGLMKFKWIVICPELDTRRRHISTTNMSSQWNRMDSENHVIYRVVWTVNNCFTIVITGLELISVELTIYYYSYHLPTLSIAMAIVFTCGLGLGTGISVQKGGDEEWHETVSYSTNGNDPF